MKANTIKYYLIFIIVFIPFYVFPQSRSLELPYEIIKGKMIVKMDINGNEERLFFDTGSAQSALTSKYVNKQNLKTVDSISVTDVTSNTVYYKRVEIETITANNGSLEFKNFKVMVIPNSDIIDCYNVVGIIGSDLLDQTMCEINPNNRTIKISQTANPFNESLRYLHNFSKKGSLPIFQIQINGEFVNVLFDTGSSSFLNLNNDDYHLLKEKNLVKTIGTGYGFQSIGLSNIIKADSISRVYITNVRIGPARISALVSDIESVPITLLGTKVLEYSKIIIDYPMRRLYLIPFNIEVINPVTKLPNLEFTIKNSQLIIANTWDTYKNKVSAGDFVTHINGVPLGTFDFCDLINGVEMLKGEEPKRLTIKNKNGEVFDYEYKYEVLGL